MLWFYPKMSEDKFVQQIQDKMNYGVSKLSPIARNLYFPLTGAFRSLGRKKEIKIALIKLSENLRINNQKQSDIKSIIEEAFHEIHKNTFVKYEFSFKYPSDSDQLELYVSLVDNKEENKALIERMSFK